MTEGVDLDKIRKLLELARSAGDTAEGRSAREKAEARLRAAGLTEDQVLADRRVAMEGRVQIWEQALIESVAELDGCGLEVDRKGGSWVLRGPCSVTRMAQDRFQGIRRQLRVEVTSYMALIRRAMRECGDDPAQSRGALERIRKAFLEAATASVATRILERVLAEREQDEEASSDDEGGAPTKSKPFDKLLDKIDQADPDWDLEIQVPPSVPDPMVAGSEAGSGVHLDPPWGDELDVRSGRALAG